MRQSSWKLQPACFPPLSLHNLAILVSKYKVACASYSRNHFMPSSIGILASRFSMASSDPYFISTNYLGPGVRHTYTFTLPRQHKALFSSGAVSSWRICADWTRLKATPYQPRNLRRVKGRRKEIRFTASLPFKMQTSRVAKLINGNNETGLLVSTRRPVEVHYVLSEARGGCNRDECGGSGCQRFTWPHPGNADNQFSWRWIFGSRRTSSVEHPDGGIWISAASRCFTANAIISRRYLLCHSVFGIVVWLILAHFQLTGPPLCIPYLLRCLRSACSRWFHLLQERQRTWQHHLFIYFA